ncbi:DMT family transporter [Arenibaculum pallidiluteum]|uniref:DMT family transporter n=1 Tax=Arenibaculum pallidiluteum TaxID=2812559 RepID=UPI001A95AC2E|nr:DMT family transporter [Arenibaculum pallidiluteum]
MQDQDNRRGIVMMLLGMTLFAWNDALGKWLVVGYPVAMILAVRSLFALAVLTPPLRRTGLRWDAVRRRPGTHLFRAFCNTAEIGCFYWAVRDLPLAEVMTIYMAAPLLVTALSVPLLGERVGWRRWLAVGVGFGGVVMVLQPSGALAPMPSLVAVLGTVCFSLGMLATRSLRDTGPAVLAWQQTVVSLLCGGVLLPWIWVPPGPVDFLLMGLLGIVALGAHLALNRSLQLAPAAIVVPFQYISIVWAVVLGVTIWNDVPSAQAGAGALLIVASGLYIFHREQQAARGSTAEAVASEAPP